MAKEDMGLLIGSILKKKPGKPEDKEDKEYSGEEEEEESNPREAISQDLIDAVKAEDASAVTDALDAIYEAWMSEPKKSHKDCGCK